MNIDAMRSDRVWRRAFWWIIGSCSLLFIGAVSLHPGGPSGRNAYDDIAECIAPLIAVLSCGLTARKTTGRERVSWALIGLGAGAWALGQIGWTIYELGLGREPASPWIGDAGFLLSPLLIITGLLLFVSTTAGVLSRLRGGLEALLITGGSLIAAWPALIAPVLAGSDSAVAAQAVTLAYPVLDATALAALLFLVSRPRVHAFGDLTSLGVGIFALAAADSSFWYVTTVESVNTAYPADAGWIGGFLLIAVSALFVRPTARARPPRTHDEARYDQRRSRSASRSPREWLKVVLPELVALFGIAFGVAWQLAHGTGMTKPHAYLITALAVVAVLYGLGALAENHVLTTDLEDRVIERTEQLAARERFYSALVENSFDATMVVSSDLVIDSLTDGDHGLFSAGTESLIGHRLDEYGDRFAPLVSTLISSPPAPGDVRQLNWQLADHAGAERFTESHITNMIDDPDVRGFIVNARDITKRVGLEREMRHQAFHDQLTGLANRALFNDRVEQALIRAQRSGRSIAALVIDLDDFKYVNDSLGHDAGDAVLRSVAEMLTSLTRVGDTVARLGGDEFAVLMEDITQDDVAVRAAERILGRLHTIVTATVVVDYVLTASIGVALSEGPNPTMIELLRDADLAMYGAKASGKDTVQPFERWMHDKAQHRFRLQTDLSGALERNEFVLYYQPCWTLDTGRLEGFEALIRWIHPTLGLVPPDQFIPLVEESGLIVPIGRWVLRQATWQLAEWSRQLAEAADLTMAVNVSARQLRSMRLADEVHEAIERSGIAPSRLVLEITESVLVTDPQFVGDVLGSLKERGIRIAIDDFGTGYSSLAYLQNLPIDILKIDKAFVDRLTDSSDEPADGNLVGPIIHLARTLGLATIAEGVELPGQATVLIEQGCDSAQGYLWSRPLPAADVWALTQDALQPKVAVGA